MSITQKRHGMVGLPFHALVGLQHEILAQMAERAIIYAVQAAWLRCNQQPPEEPDVVAALTVDMTRMLGTHWGSFFEQFGICFSLFGVYCHQRPKVTYANMPSHHDSCELGDLLIVHCHHPRHAPTERTAILLQAKVRPDHHRIASDDYHQLRLYEQWPEFSYTTILRGISRDITPKHAHAGAQFLLIDERPPWDISSGIGGWPGAFPLGIAIPAPILSIYRPFQLCLTEMLLGVAGRPVKDKQEAYEGSGWSAMVWDLLQSAVEKAFNRRHAGYHKQPRGIFGSASNHSDGQFMAFCTPGETRQVSSTIRRILGEGGVGMLYTTGDAEPPTELPPEGEYHDQQSGISLILIETAEMNSE